MPDALCGANCEAVTTQSLGTPRLTEQPYENADGSPIDFTEDFLRNHRTGNLIPGPFGTLKPGKQSFVAWEEAWSDI